MTWGKMLWLVVISWIGLTACGLNNDDVVIPTEASVDQFATETFLTANAPPQSADIVYFPQIDQGIESTVYARYVVDISFNGVYSDSREPVESTMRVEVWLDEFNARRSVKIIFEGGDVFQGSGGNLDAVRINNNYYMVNPNGVCRTTPEEVQAIANLTAGQLIGGVQEAYTSWKQVEINNQRVWSYSFGAEMLNPPAIQILNPETGVVDPVSGELWVTFDEANQLPPIVIRYTVEMNVHRAVLLFGNREVTGQMRYEYQVYDIGVPPPISIPNGC